MTGFSWTYDDLVRFVNYHGPPPRPINPQILRLLEACPGSCVHSIGGHNVIIGFPGDTQIIAKLPKLVGDEDHLVREQSVRKVIAASPSPWIAHAFCHKPGISFLELVAGDQLYTRVVSKRTPRPVGKWMLQLSMAVAAVEAAGYAHGDINPGNVLLDNSDDVKLIDFDYALEVGQPVDVGDEPYVRRQVGASDYGAAGAETELFALGSLFWFMSRGETLYHDVDGPDVVDKMGDLDLPYMDHDNPVDRIIDNCWRGVYPRVSDLCEDIRQSLEVDADAGTQRD